MKIIVPLAGKGTRLLPLTKRVPKPLIRVAGRPVMDYVMDAIAGSDLEELIVITGHLKDVVERYIVEHYDVKARFVEQKTLDGTAGAINLARPYVKGPVLIIFVDTLFDADLSLIKTADADGIIWTKEVEDYRRFGVIVTDGRGYMTRIVEKPDTPVSRLANIGLQYIKDWKTLFEGIAHVLKQPPGKGGEFYLTDAFQYMVDRGRRLRVGEATGWYDCGKVDTLLETNRHLLEQGRARLSPLHHRAPGLRGGGRHAARRDDRAERRDRGGELRHREHDREQHPRPERAGGPRRGPGLARGRRPGDRREDAGAQRPGCGGGGADDIARLT